MRAAEPCGPPVNLLAVPRALWPLFIVIAYFYLPFQNPFDYVEDTLERHRRFYIQHYFSIQRPPLSSRKLYCNRGVTR